MNVTLQIIKKYKLDDYLKDLILYNNGNNNPYHNFFHTQTIVKNIYFIAKDVGLKDSEIRLLCIAGLFHDFNHSAGKFKDDKNIEIALESFRKYSKENEKDNLFIESTIKATQYPYVKNDGLTINEEIIRDADIMQTLESNFFQQCIFGLNKEMNNSDELKKKNFEGQISFMKSIKIFTPYCQSIVEEKFPSIIDDCEYMVKLLS